MLEMPTEQEIRQVLLEMTHSEEPTLWEDVKLQLLSLPEDLIVPILAEGVHSEDPRVRCEWGDLLMTYQGGRHVELYRPLFRDPVDWVRWNITGCASTLQGVNLDFEIQERLLTDEDVSVQVQATLYLSHVVGLPAIPFLLWLITHPTEPDLLGHTRDSAAENSLTRLLLWQALRRHPSVLHNGDPFVLGPMTCTTQVKEIPREETGYRHETDDEIIGRYGHPYFQEKLQGKTPHRVTLVAESPHGCFSVEMDAWLDEQDVGSTSLTPTTYQFWGVPDEPPPLRVQG